MTEQDTVTMLGPASALLSLCLVITARADNNFLTGEGFVILCDDIDTFYNMSKSSLYSVSMSIPIPRSRIVIVSDN